MLCCCSKSGNLAVKYGHAVLQAHVLGSLPRFTSRRRWLKLPLHLPSAEAGPSHLIVCTGAGPHHFLRSRVALLMSAARQQVPTPAQAVPAPGDRILRLRRAWLDLILSGTKTAEVRRDATTPGGVWLGCGGRVEAFGLLGLPVRVANFAEFQSRFEEHRVDVPALPYGPCTYLWPLTDVRILPAPVCYHNRAGPVTWLPFALPPSRPATSVGAEEDEVPFQGLFCKDSVKSDGDLMITFSDVNGCEFLCQVAVPPQKPSERERGSGRELLVGFRLISKKKPAFEEAEGRSGKTLSSPSTPTSEMADERSGVDDDRLVVRRRTPTLALPSHAQSGLTSKLKKRLVDVRSLSLRSNSDSPVRPGRLQSRRAQSLRSAVDFDTLPVEIARDPDEDLQSVETQYNEEFNPGCAVCQKKLEV
ncbi:hypothetical protein AK812_SmicGene7896 [Symbiodinium microadriaticum]|uniref:Uncharacterized protein n=1 Tax=Symbiodinium microadriaticum TaxID=2951 RepID=A0A1Q9EMC2_SYMMI|nr:hypothetical protein AK812_SmicGene7896 [Symbiodinium microadriaticum]